MVSSSWLLKMTRKVTVQFHHKHIFLSHYVLQQLFLLMIGKSILSSVTNSQYLLKVYHMQIGRTLILFQSLHRKFYEYEIDSQIFKWCDTNVKELRALAERRIKPIQRKIRPGQGFTVSLGFFWSLVCTSYRMSRVDKSYMSCTFHSSQIQKQWALLLFQPMKVVYKFFLHPY